MVLRYKCNGTDRSTHHHIGLRACRCVAILTLFATCTVVPLEASPCDQLNTGKSFWIRLLDPVASYSTKAGTPVRAALIQSPECSSTPVFPAGLEVDGTVVAVRKVGMGIRHDTASLTIRFDRLTAADGEVLPITADVVEIDNAREHVKNGVIRGIRATNTPQGRITSRLIHMPTLNPYSDMGLIVYRALTILPEPEIYLPPGTDLRLRLTQPLNVANQPDLVRPSFVLDEYERGEVEMLLEKTSPRTTTSKGSEADLVNLMFLGTPEEIAGAFEAAGWLAADHNSPYAFLKQFNAFLTYSNYPTMPISMQFLDGQRQDMTWQKSFNSYSKREHLRLWSQETTVNGEQAWLSAYTRETGAELSVKYHGFIHRIDRNVDDGVNMLVRDLSLTGCVESVHQISRPDVQHLMMNATGDEIYTDGNLTIVQLKACPGGMVLSTRDLPLIPIRPRSVVARYLRGQILVYKSDVVRGNIIYSAFDLSRMALHSFLHRHGDADYDYEDLPMSPVSPETLFPITLGK